MTGKIRPNLAALRALETAARHRSFTLAADELCVTHSAVSHQIRKLESLLGIRLFTRAGQEMVPTPMCVQFSSRLRRNLADIDIALDEVRNDRTTSRQRVSVSVMSDFANAWLIPRLGDFSNAHPHIDLSLKVHAEIKPPDPHSVDVGIWHQRIEETGFRSVLLLQDRVIAVCSPGFRALNSSVTTNFLSNVRLLRFETRSWDEFFQAAGIAHQEPQDGPIFSDAASLLNAALAGQGVAMLRERLVEPYIQSQALVKIVDVHIPAQLNYYMVWREESLRKQAIHCVTGWFRQRIAEKSIHSDSV